MNPLLIVAGVTFYIVCGFVCTRLRWRSFIKREAAYQKACLFDFLRGDLMTEFRYQMWADIVEGDSRLRRFPPVPDQYAVWLTCNIFFWPVIAIRKLMTSAI